MARKLAHPDRSQYAERYRKNERNEGDHEGARNQWNDTERVRKDGCRPTSSGEEVDGGDFGEEEERLDDKDGDDANGRDDPYRCRSSKEEFNERLAPAGGRGGVGAMSCRYACHKPSSR